MVQHSDSGPQVCTILPGLKEGIGVFNCWSFNQPICALLCAFVKLTNEESPTVTISLNAMDKNLVFIVFPLFLRFYYMYVMSYLEKIIFGKQLGTTPNSDLGTVQICYMH